MDKIKLFMKDYRPEKSILRKDTVRSIALQAVGELLNEIQDKECLEYLVSVLDEESREYTDIRYLAYISLIKALHLDFQKIPFIDATEIMRENPFVTEILKMARKLISEIPIRNTNEDIR
jgi:hypothetical protein